MVRIIINFFIFLLFFLNCAENKSEISKLDLKRLIQRISTIRVNEHIESKDASLIKSDRQIFLESCEILRLKPSNALSKIKELNPKLYKKLAGIHGE